MRLVLDNDVSCPHFSHRDNMKGGPMFPAVKWNLSGREEELCF